jgi:hypothetical protein
MSGRAMLQHEIHRTAQRHAKQQQVVVRGTVESIDPLVVQPFDYAHHLTRGNDLELTAWMVLYDDLVGLRTGDLVLLHKTDSWTVFDVVSDNPLLTRKFKAALS